MPRTLKQLPIFPTTVVGSFEKPDYLLKAVRNHRKGLITAEELKKVRLKALQDIIQLQEEVGLDILVDGEVEREEMTIFFAEKFNGLESSGWVRSYGNRYYRKPIITGPVRWPGPMTVDFFQEAQRLTDKPVKGMFTGPYTMVDWSFDEYYRDRKNAVLDFAKQYRLEAEALQKAGCQLLQIDEPAASVRVDEWDLFCEGLEIITKGLGIYTICHICYGEFEQVPDFNKIPVDNLDLECANNRFNFLKEGRPFCQDISAGVFDVHTHKQTSKEELVQNIKNVLKFFPPEKVWIDPDCGLRTRAIEEARSQLKIMVEAAKEMRQELGAVS